MIKVNHLSKKFGNLEVLKDINLDINEGEVVCIIGPSGSGKSTFLRCINQLERPTGGTVQYEGKNLLDKNCDIRKFREEVGMVFQKFNLFPLKTVVQNVMMAPILTKHMNKEEAHAKALELLDKVGLKDKADVYPSTLSGGQQQRICIARALALNPEFVVCDEAVSALDVSVRAQVLNLMRNMQQKKNLTYLFISHDLSVVRHISDRIAVMYLGSVVEVAEKAQLYSNPMHPYTKALLSAIPLPDVKKKRQRIILEGDVPSAYNPPSGCKFHTRCPYATVRCRQEAPVLQEVEKGHKAACHRALELA